jgi:hypothetical protein
MEKEAEDMSRAPVEPSRASGASGQSRRGVGLFVTRGWGLLSETSLLGPLDLHDDAVLNDREHGAVLQTVQRVADPAERRVGAARPGIAVVGIASLCRFSVLRVHDGDRPP